MNGSFAIGRIFGVALRMHWSAPLLVTVIGYGLGRQTLPAWVPGRSPAVYAFAGVAGSALLLGSLLLHEAAHAITARRNGTKVQDMTLWAMGGMTRMDRPATAPAAMAVAVAGPVTSFAIGGCVLAAGVGLNLAAGWAVPAALMVWLGWANLLLGGFNLLPAVPLDGGRMLHALLWWRSGDRDRAELAADRCGQAAGALLVAAGWIALLSGVPGGLWLALIGLFVALAAGAERQRASLMLALRGKRVAEVMSSPVVTAADWLTVDRLMSDSTYQARPSVLPLLDFEGRLSGIAEMRRIATVPRARWAETRLRDVADPGSQCTLVAPEDLLDGVVERIRTPAGLRILAMQGGTPVGIITAHDLQRLLQRRRPRPGGHFPARHLPR
jgi:Zn-dependent protease